MKLGNFDSNLLGKIPRVLVESVRQPVGFPYGEMFYVLPLSGEEVDGYSRRKSEEKTRLQGRKVVRNIFPAAGSFCETGLPFAPTVIFEVYGLTTSSERMSRAPEVGRSERIL